MTFMMFVRKKFQEFPKVGRISFGKAEKTSKLHNNWTVALRTETRLDRSCDLSVYDELGNDLQFRVF